MTNEQTPDIARIEALTAEVQSAYEKLVAEQTQENLRAWLSACEKLRVPLMEVPWLAKATREFSTFAHFVGTGANTTLVKLSTHICADEMN